MNLTQVFYRVSEKLYSQPGAQAQEGSQDGTDAGTSDADGQQYYDADYEVVDDDSNNNK